MDFSKVNILIEQNRNLTEMSSLPFSIDENDKRNVAWFNYSVVLAEMGMIGRVRKAFTVDEDMNVREISTVVDIELLLTECGEPKVTELEYIGHMSEQYNTLDSKTNMQSLKEAVLEIFVPIYETVVNYLFSEERQRLNFDN